MELDRIGRRVEAAEVRRQRLLHHADSTCPCQPLNSALEPAFRPPTICSLCSATDLLALSRGSVPRYLTVPRAQRQDYYRACLLSCRMCNGRGAGFWACLVKELKTSI